MQAVAWLVLLVVLHLGYKTAFMDDEKAQRTRTFAQQVLWQMQAKG